MFAPPRSFSQLQNAQWAGAAAALLPALGLVPPGAGLDALLLAWLGCAVLLLAAGLWVVWLSSFGTGHVLVGCAIMAALFLPPLALLAAIALVPARAGGAFALVQAGTAAALLACLAASTAVLNRKLPPLDTAAPSCKLFSRQISLSRRTFAIAAEAAATSGPSPWKVGVGSVVLFNAMALFTGRKPESHILLAITVAGAALWFWLCLRFLAPALVLALRLHRLERDGGACFIPEDLARVEVERQRHALGRLLRRRFPLPACAQPLRRGTATRRPARPD